jgi:ABC-type lipoprotein export system ATPase subunit
MMRQMDPVAAMGQLVTHFKHKTKHSSRTTLGLLVQMMHLYGRQSLSKNVSLNEILGGFIEEISIG